VPVHKYLPSPGALAGHWDLNEEIVFLNHGSFGACPSAVLKHREMLLRRAERDPMEFLLEFHQPLKRELTALLESFTGAQPGSIVMVENATTGINTILRNLPVEPGDSILVTDQEYFSSANALEILADDLGLSVVKVHIPWPVKPDTLLESFERALKPGVRYALVDHIVSSSGVVMPLKEIIELLGSRGIETIVDGAHGPGQIPLDLSKLGCMAYTGNCHKWMGSPRSAALLYVRPDFQAGFRPLVISHLPGEFSTDLSDFQLFFAWNGTPDPTPELSVTYAMDFMQGLLPGGWGQIMEQNRGLALKARDLICTELGTEPPCPESMVGSMASVTLPGEIPLAGRSLHWVDPLQRTLRDRYGIVIPVTRIGSARLLRVSSQLYNSEEQYKYLAYSLRKIFTG